MTIDSLLGIRGCRRRSWYILSLGHSRWQLAITGILSAIAFFGSSDRVLAQSAFLDLENHWASDCIEKLREKQILTGYPDNTFRPEEPVTRAEYATLLKRAFPNVDRVRESTNFRDVSASDWAREAIADSYQTGFLTGYPGQIFQPRETLQRVQALVALARGLKYSPTEAIATIINSAFTDAHEIPEYARSSLAAAMQKRLVVNYPDVQLFKPMDVASRADIAAFLCQALVEPGELSGVPQQYVAQTGKIEVEMRTIVFEQIQVELSYQKFPEASSLKYGNLRIQINRNGRVVLEAPVPRAGESARFDFVKSESPAIVVDLEGDRQPEILLDFYTGGAHCCYYTVIYGYQPDTEEYAAIKHWWHNSYYNLVNLNNEGNLEFKSADDSFSYAFGPYATSFRPLQIWQYRQGKMIDVTRDFPKQVYSDSSRLYQIFEENKEQCNAQKWGGCHEGLLAAYLATKYLLEQEDSGWDFVRQAYRGNGCLVRGDRCPGRQSYFQKLRSFLWDTGYSQR